MIESGIYRMKSGDFAWALFRSFGRGAAAPAAVLPAAAIAASAFDIRFVVLALMLVLVVAPMVLMWLYYSYGLRCECFMNVLPHTVSVTEKGVRVRIYTERDSEEQSEWKYRDLFFDASDFSRYRVTADAVEFPVGDPVRGFLWLPAAAFGSESDFADAVGGIARSDNRNESALC